MGPAYLSKHGCFVQNSTMLMADYPDIQLCGQLAHFYIHKFFYLQRKRFHKIVNVVNVNIYLLSHFAIRLTPDQSLCGESNELRITKPRPKALVAVVSKEWWTGIKVELIIDQNLKSMPYQKKSGVLCMPLFWY